MLHDKPPTRAQLGSMHHICLEVPEIQPAYEKLLAHGLGAEERYKPRVGRNRKRLLNLFDADGTRTELMEPKTID
jgi:lactoylglutathione lyase